MTAPTPRRGRPTKRAAAELEDRIRHAAVAAFAVDGFDGATMDDIAAAAGVTKRTLYAKYPDKRTLFATVIPWALSAAHHNDRVAPVDPTDLRRALTSIARAAVARATDQQIAALSRIAIAAAAEFPEFRTSTETLTWSPRLRSVVDVLEHHRRLGTVAIDDAALSAEQFLAMVTGLPTILALYGLRRSTAAESRRIDHAVTTFIHGIAAPGGATSSAATAQG